MGDTPEEFASDVDAIARIEAAMSQRLVSSAEETAELNRLSDALAVAIQRAREILRETDMTSPAYRAADAEVSRILARINQMTNGKRDP